MKKRAFLLAVPNMLVVGAAGFELGLRCENLLVYLAYPVACVFGWATALIGIVYGARARRKGTSLAVLCAATIAASALVPAIWRWRESLEFALKRQGYLGVVELVRQGRIEADSSQLAEVDAAHEYLLPCKKQIAIEEGDGGLSVIIFTSNAMFGEFKGYMYVESGRPPTAEQFRELRYLSPDQWTVVRRMDANWYYVIFNH